MMRSLTISSDGAVQKDLELEAIRTGLGKKDALLWIDLTGNPGNQFKHILEDVFGFHPLAVEEALSETHIPKVVDWGNYLYLVLRGILINPEGNIEIQIPELDIFLGPNYIVTYHEKPMTAIDTIWQLCLRGQQHPIRRSVNLLYQLVDELINEYMLVIEQIDETINQIEDAIFDSPKMETLNQIFSLKRSLLLLRRTLLPQRELFSKLSRAEFGLIQDHDTIYFRNLYDHMVRLQEISESSRDLVSGSLETYLSVVNNRMNEVMKTLTIITTLFMPLSFLTGFFGMNFFQAVIPLGAWTGKLAFLFVLIVMVSAPISMYVWMRRRNWM